jgi:hypothetical protein
MMTHRPRNGLRDEVARIPEEGVGEPALLVYNACEVPLVVAEGCGRLAREPLHPAERHVLATDPTLLSLAVAF